MTSETRSYATYLPLLKLVFVGLVAGSLLTGGLALNAVALTLLLAALLIVTRGDVIYALIAIALGAVIVVLFPQLSFTALDPLPALACVALMILL